MGIFLEINAFIPQTHARQLSESIALRRQYIAAFMAHFPRCAWWHWEKLDE